MKLENGTYQRSYPRYTWWLRKTNYFEYMLREVSSLFIAITALTLIWGIYHFSQGPDAYVLWLSNLRDNLLPGAVLCFVFAVYHSITWFWVTPKAMPLMLGGKRLAGSVIIGAHIIAWLVVSLGFWLVVSGGLL